MFTDTDSLCYEIKSDDVYKDLFQDKELFDNSDYPKIVHSFLINITYVFRGCHKRHKR